jgi:hypothetical protein
VLVEETNERPDGARCIVVFALPRRARCVLEIAQIDVVAQRGAVVRPLLLTAISGPDCSLDFGWMPTSAPGPTADIGCDLVKISASGPMPTSDIATRRPGGSAPLDRAASGDPGRIFAGLSPITATISRRTDSAPHRPRLLHDHAFERAGDERHAARLQRRRSHVRRPRLRRIAGTRGVGQHVGGRAAAAAFAARIAATGLSRLSNWLEVAATAEVVHAVCLHAYEDGAPSAATKTRP